MTETLPKLRETFKSLFFAPFASHHWASHRGRLHWSHLEGWLDSLAGPLYTIIKTGGCEYVYSRDDVYFREVSNPSELSAKLLSWLEEVAAGVKQFEANTSEEVADLAFMYLLIGGIQELVEEACAVEQFRWQSTKHA